MATHQCHNGHDHEDSASKNACNRGMRLESDFSDQEKVACADGNHIWLNAFSCIRPTDEFLIGIGRRVVHIVTTSKMADPFVGVSPVAYIRVNAS